MKRWKKYAGLLLALVLCLSLTACGGGNADVGGDESEETTSNAIPDSIEDLVLDDSVEYDYSYFLGEWLDEEGNVITVEEYDDGRVHFLLSDANEDLIAGGPLQYVEEYGCVYAIDNVGGDGSRCLFDGNDTLEIPGYSTFSRVNGDESDYIVIYGTWYPDGDESASRCIEFDSDGALWSMYERNTNGLWDGVDGGTLYVTGVNQYEAVSDWYEDERFDCYFEGDTMYWGSEDSGYEEYY